MAKKFKSSANQSAPERHEKVTNGETASHLGISVKSKKIKKQKPQKNLTKIKDAAKTETVVDKVMKTGKRETVALAGKGNGNGSGVGPKKSKKAKHDGVKVKLERTEQESKKKKKHQKDKVKDEPKGLAEGTEIEDVHKKTKRKKDKASEVDAELSGERPKKHKKSKEPEGNDNSVAVSKQEKRHAETEQTENREDKPHKKHRKKNKHKKHLEGAKEEQLSPKEPKFKAKHNKQKRAKAIEVGKDEALEVEPSGEEPLQKHQKRKGPEGKETAVAENREDEPRKQHKKKNKHKKYLQEAAQEQSQPPSRAELKQKRAKAIEADKDVVTSESESDEEDEPMNGGEDEVNRNILKQHSAEADGESSGDEERTGKKVDGEQVEEKKEKRFKGPEHSIFIGNLPNTVKKSAMKSMFQQYGKILTVRFRSNDGITLFRKKDRLQAKALNCYIRFETKQQAEAACATNGQLVEGNRIRVTMHTQKQIGHTASTIFVGNINRKTTDNELYDFFSRVGEIEYVRQIADKGIGFVCFKKGVSIAKALKLNQQLLNGRPLRIVKADPTKQGKRKNKKGNLVDKAKFQHPGGAAAQSAIRRIQKNQQHGGQNQKKPQVREFHGAIAKANADGKHKHTKSKKGGGSDKKKKLLAQKLMAAGGSRKV